MIMLILAWCIPADAAIYRSSSEDDIQRGRKAVTFIDMGRIKDGAYQLNYFTLVCVDGVKIYTVTDGGKTGIQSFIIPGRCDGLTEPKPKPKVIYVPTNNSPEQQTPNNKEDFLTW